MGFFADIIRDSRGGGNAPPARQLPLSRSGEDPASDAPVMAEGGGRPDSADQWPGRVAAVAGPLAGNSTAVNSPAAGVADEMVKGAVIPDPVLGEPAGWERDRTVTDDFNVDETVIRLREEGGGQPDSAGQRPGRIGTVARQVVGPSTAEHTPARGLPGVRVKGLVLPNPVIREQTGCESARTVRDDFRIERMESFHDGDSSDAPSVLVSSNGSSKGEYSSGYAASRAGKMSVETQGRRQAGEMTRAGSTTPPEQSAGAMSEKPLRQPVAEAVAALFPGADAAGTREEVRSAVLAVGESFREEIGQGTHSLEIPPVNVSAPDDIQAAGRRFHPESEREQLTSQRTERLGESRRSPPPPEPQVRIGTIEVVVVAPAPAEHSPRGVERPRPDLASRHYLRNF